MKYESDYIQGKIKDDDWETIIKESSTSICYKCHNSGRLYFKKSLKSQFLNNNRYRSAFHKEFHIGSIIDCPYIVKYCKIIDHDEECSLYLDFVDGKNLKELLEANPYYFKSRNVLTRFTRQLLEALQYMHHRQIIYMDLNPSNVMISSKTNDVKVTDLGFCYSDSYQDTPGTTQAFSASELRNGSYDFDVRADIYAFGCILKFIDEFSSLPRHYKMVMKKCLAEKKENRYATVDDVIKVLFPPSPFKKIAAVIIFVVAVMFLFFITDCPRHVHRLLYGYEFVDRDGIAYNITSTDSMTCIVMGYHMDKDQRPKRDYGHVVVPDQTTYHGHSYSITSIADSAFYRDSIVTMISLMPKTLTVGHRGLAYMKNLYYLSFAGDNVTLLSGALENIRNVRNIDYPRNLKVIPSTCFYWCCFKHLNLPEGITTIEQDAYVSCQKLVDAILPSTLISLGRGVFYDCVKLEEVRIPAATKEIGMFCFMQCPKLKRIYNYATTPQQVSDIFDDDAHITIYVPRQSVSLYRKAHGWNTQDIQPMPEE